MGLGLSRPEAADFVGERAAVLLRDFVVAVPVNSTHNHSIGSQMTMGNLSIEKNDGQLISELIPPNGAMHDEGFEAAIDDVVEVIGANSIHKTAIGDHRIMGNMSIEEDNEQLTSNLISQVLCQV
jgi:hypothetical protein